MSIHLVALVQLTPHPSTTSQPFAGGSISGIPFVDPPGYVGTRYHDNAINSDNSNDAAPQRNHRTNIRANNQVGPEHSNYASPPQNSRGSYRTSTRGSSQTNAIPSYLRSPANPSFTMSSLGSPIGSRWSRREDGQVFYNQLEGPRIEEVRSNAGTDDLGVLEYPEEPLPSGTAPPSPPRLRPRSLSPSVGPSEENSWQRMTDLGPPTVPNSPEMSYGRTSRRRTESSFGSLVRSVVVSPLSSFNPETVTERLADLMDHPRRRVLSPFRHSTQNSSSGSGRNTSSGPSRSRRTGSLSRSTTSVVWTSPTQMPLLFTSILTASPISMSPRPTLLTSQLETHAAPTRMGPERPPPTASLLQGASAQLSTDPPIFNSSRRSPPPPPQNQMPSTQSQPRTTASSGRQPVPNRQPPSQLSPLFPSEPQSQQPLHNSGFPTPFGWSGPPPEMGPPPPRPWAGITGYPDPSPPPSSRPERSNPAAQPFGPPFPPTVPSHPWGTPGITGYPDPSPPSSSRPERSDPTAQPFGPSFPPIVPPPWAAAGITGYLDTGPPPPPRPERSNPAAQPFGLSFPSTVPPHPWGTAGITGYPDPSPPPSSRPERSNPAAQPFGPSFPPTAPPGLNRPFNMGIPAGFRDPAFPPPAHDTPRGPSSGMPHTVPFPPFENQAQGGPSGIGHATNAWPPTSGFDGIPIPPGLGSFPGSHRPATGFNPTPDFRPPGRHSQPHQPPMPNQNQNQQDLGSFAGIIQHPPPPSTRPQRPSSTRGQKESSSSSSLGQPQAGPSRTRTSSNERRRRRKGKAREGFIPSLGVPRYQSTPPPPHNRIALPQRLARPPTPPEDISELLETNLRNLEFAQGDVNGLSMYFGRADRHHNVNLQTIMTRRVSTAIRSLEVVLTRQKTLTPDQLRLGTDHWIEKTADRLSSLGRTILGLGKFVHTISGREPTISILQKGLTKLSEFESKLSNLASKFNSLLNRLHVRELHSMLSRAHAEAHSQLRNAQSKRDLPGWEEGKRYRAELRREFIDFRNSIARARRASLNS